MLLSNFAKAQLARDVVVGRRSLWEAAALFAGLNRRPFGSPGWSRHALDAALRLPPDPLRPDEERLCWQVIAWVRSPSTQGMPGRERAAVRLEAELRAALWGGGVRLPDPRSLESTRELLARARDSLSEPEWDAMRGRAGSRQRPEEAQAAR
jgi:hypothetical protein